MSPPVFTPDFITGALAARIVGAPSELPGADVVSTDTRSIGPGALYVPLVGERFDGHDYIAQAFEAGAHAALASRPVPEFAERVLVVDDTLAALQDLAAAHLQRLPGKRIALTGSNGKTTTKELLAAACAGCVGRDAVHATAGNLNNHIGVPLTALAARDSHEILILEMGMNHFGEIARLCDIAMPEAGAVTNIQGAHAGNLGGIEGVAKAKGEMFEHLAAHRGTAVANLDDARCVARAAACSRQVTFGTAAAADVRLHDVQQGDTSLRFKLDIEGRCYEAEVPLVGAHNALNAAAALALVVALDLDPAAAVAGLSQTRAPSGRLALRSAGRAAQQNWRVLDDTYNANPASLSAGLDALASIGGNRLRAVAVGDMLELGDEAEATHFACGEALAQYDIGCVFACGELGAQVAAGAVNAGADDMKVVWAEDSAALAPLVRDALPPGAAILVKGSRGARMERVVNALVEEA